MKRKINNLFLLTIVFSGIAFAQKEKPNFSGTWNLDKKESGLYLLGNEMFGLSNVLFENCSEKISIEHKEPELLIKKTSICQKSDKSKALPRTTESTYRYFTDERGEVNDSRDYQTVESKTKWENNKLIITVYQTDEKNGKRKFLVSKELSVSKNKENLTEKIIRHKSDLYSSQPSYTKMVYKISK